MTILFTYDPRRDATTVHKIHYEVVNGVKRRRHKSIGSIACKEYNSGFNKYKLASAVKENTKEKLKASINLELKRFVEIILEKKYCFYYSRFATTEEDRYLTEEEQKKIQNECKRLNAQYQSALHELLSYDEKKKNRDYWEMVANDEKFDEVIFAYGYGLPDDNQSKKSNKKGNDGIVTANTLIKILKEKAKS